MRGELWLELDDDHYYKITCHVVQRDDEKWVATVSVMRKDTRGTIGHGISVVRLTRQAAIDDAKSAVDQYLMPELRSIGKPPDWECEIEQIVLRCKCLRSKILQFGEDTAKYISGGGDSDKFLDDYALFWMDFIDKTVELTRHIQCLTPEERACLLEIGDDALSDPSKSDSLGEIDARIMAFKFFAAHTEQEEDLHNRQRQKLDARFKELGWE